MSETLYKALERGGMGPYSGFDFAPYLPGDDGQPGKWLPIATVDRPILCQTGYHYCKRDRLAQWMREHIYVVEIAGVHIYKREKGTAQLMRFLRKTAFNGARARLFAADCASRTLHIYENEMRNDPRLRDALLVAYMFAAGAAASPSLHRAWEDAWNATKGVESTLMQGTPRMSAVHNAAAAVVAACDFNHERDMARDVSRVAAWDYSASAVYHDTLLYADRDEAIRLRTEETRWAQTRLVSYLADQMPKPINI